MYCNGSEIELSDENVYFAKYLEVEEFLKKSFFHILIDKFGLSQLAIEGNCNKEEDYLDFFQISVFDGEKLFLWEVILRDFKFFQWISIPLNLDLDLTFSKRLCDYNPAVLFVL